MSTLNNVTMENKQQLVNKFNQIDAAIAALSGGGSVDYTEYVAYTIVTGGGVATTVVKNDLGFTPTISKTSTGEYTITAIGGFPDFEKIVPSFNPQQGSPTFWNIFWNDADTLIVNTWDASGTLADLFIGNLTIKIYA